MESHALWCLTGTHVVQHCNEKPDSWVTEDQFKAGLALIQAMPGPMFNLCASQLGRGIEVSMLGLVCVAPCHVLVHRA